MQTDTVRAGHITFHTTRWLLAGLIAAMVFWPLAPAMAAVEAQKLADEIMNDNWVKGGLAVHVGCKNGRVAAALGTNEKFLVQALVADADNLQKARQYIKSKNCRRRVSVRPWKGDYLPYNDNLVNLLVVQQPADIKMDEIMRALAPRGVAYIEGDDGWQKTAKPWPDDIDEWTHYLHDASGNGVADDSSVGPPTHIQWKAGPLHCRSHEIDTSVCAVVSAAGRIFYILDRGLPGITDPRLPQQWSLVARDAFSGVRLWNGSIPNWGWPQWKKSQLKDKNWRELRGQRIRSPIVLPRRLVANDDRVYITLGFDAPVSVLDAATGDRVRTIRGTENTDEILYTDGVLVLCTRPVSATGGKGRPKDAGAETVMAVDADSGDILWKKEFDMVLPLGFVADNEAVYVNNYHDLFRLDLETDKQQWRVDSKTPRGWRWATTNTIAVRDGVVTLLGPKKLRAYDAENGSQLWEGPGGRGAGAANPPDLFIIDDLVWAGGAHKRWGTGAWLNARRKNRQLDTVTKKTGRALHTGKVKKTVQVKNLVSPGHHFRCYRSKATERYLLWPKRGVEFLDLYGNEHARCDWLRAPCRMGFMPCNGMLYMPPHQCFCYGGAKLMGFNALENSLQIHANGDGAGERLTKGPAWGTKPTSAKASADQWPTYRHDETRSGCTPADVPAKVDERWRADIGGSLTAPVVADGKLIVSAIDRHTAHCLNAGTGEELWSYIAGGRVDSAPTYYRGLVLFGSADGQIYCLRASDGELVWRYRAAPQQRQIVAFGAVESAWPVHGSILIHDGVAYATAGRSSFLDGGIRVYGLDPLTGEKLYQARLAGPHAQIPEEPGRPFVMRGARTEVLVSQNDNIYMRQVKFDAKLNRKKTPRLSRLGQRKVGLHVFSKTSLLDDTWWNRTHWMYAKNWPGFYLANNAPKAGQILVFDDATTYAVKMYRKRNRHSPMFFPGEGYHLVADDNDTRPLITDKNKDREKGPGFERPREPNWRTKVPVRMRALTLAGNRVFAAGPPDVLKADDPMASFEGRAGAKLLAFAATDGSKLTEHDLNVPPVFDGMIAAAGNLYISATDGTVRCMGGR